MALIELFRLAGEEAPLREPVGATSLDLTRDDTLALELSLRAKSYGRPVRGRSHPTTTSWADRRLRGSLCR
jgi:hypothetical protein